MTSKKAAKTQKKTRKTGSVNVGVDGNMLRLQFPSKVSQAIWGKPQKYKSLGLCNTPENKAKADEIAAIAQQDLLRGEFDVTLEKYSPICLEKIIQKLEPTLPNIFELCQKYFDVKIKPNIKPGTQSGYKYYLAAIEQCSTYELVRNSIKIRDTIRKIRSAEQTREILKFIHKTVEWAKRNELILKTVENPYKDLIEDVTGKSNYQKPKHIREISEEDDNDCRAYSLHDAVKIIEEFAYYGRPKGVYQDFVEFLFLTGCRTSEAIALRWEDVTEDCSEIIFRHSYCIVSKEVKGLKTAAKGKSSRKFPCGEGLKQLLLKVRNSQEEIPNSKSFVFNRKGRPILRPGFHRAWAGSASTEANDGVVERLIKEGKVKTYLKPYSTRHSFITWQLNAGMTPANVARLVGNSPEMIYKHYVSADADITVLCEVRREI
jgi:integrase